MKALRDCPNNVRATGQSVWRGSLRENKGGVELIVCAARPFALHLLDDAKLITQGERCDGLLVSERGANGLTCFVELKGAAIRRRRAPQGLATTTGSALSTPRAR